MLIPIRAGQYFSSARGSGGEERSYETYTWRHEDVAGYIGISSGCVGRKSNWTEWRGCRFEF